MQKASLQLYMPNMTPRIGIMTATMMILFMRMRLQARMVLLLKMMTVVAIIDIIIVVSIIFIMFNPPVFNTMLPDPNAYP